MPDKTAVYHVSCHCQTHILRLTLPHEGLFSNNSVCDCSHCLKRRVVWAQAPAGSMQVIKGVGKDGVCLQEYTFGTKAFAHQVSLVYLCNNSNISRQVHTLLIGDLLALVLRQMRDAHAWWAVQARRRKLHVQCKN